MKRQLISEIEVNKALFEGVKVTVAGWVRSVRDSKEFGFVDLNDGSTIGGVQVVFERNKTNNYDTVAALNVGSAISVTGTVVLTPKNRQPFEINADCITIEGNSTPDYPLQKKRHTVEYLREQAYLRPRTNLFSAVFRIRSKTAFAIHKFFNERGFIYVHTPLITSSDCEGAGEMFRVTTLDIKNPPRLENGNIDYSEDFFAKPVSLTVSGQLQGESYAMAFGNIYTFGPTFRAEKSNTARHAAEFWMIEPEIAFADLSDNMDLAWDMIKYIIEYILENCKSEVEFLNSFVDKTLLKRLTELADSDYCMITYTKAVELLENCGEQFKYPVFWGADLQTEHERYITEKIFKKPVFVTDYPKEIKSFYMRLNDDGKTVAAMDLLVPGVGEIIGGSQREERTDILLKRMAECKLNEDDYKWYVNLRRFGGTKHAGYGLGFERIIMYLTGVSNIRDVIPYPRTTGHIEY